MTIGGTPIAAALASLSDMTAGAVPIGKQEHLDRIARAQAYMRDTGVAAIYVDASAASMVVPPIVMCRSWVPTCAHSNRGRAG